MHATRGDWLVIKSSSDSRHARRGEVLAAAQGGGEPFTVRWIDTGHEALVFPGPDAEIVPAARQAELDRAAFDRVVRTSANEDEIAANEERADREGRS